MVNLKSLLPEVINEVELVSSFIRHHFGKVKSQDIETKAHNSLVSFVDKQAESMLVNALNLLIQNAGFLTEEDTIDQLDQDYIWIIDPLDGTTNFLYNIPHFSVSVALQFKGKIVLGVVADVIRKEIYSAYSSGGAYMNGEMIKASQNPDFKQAVIATGFPYESAYDKEPYFQMLEIIMREARGIRRFGSAALDLAYVANGRFTAFYETSLNPWDVAAGILICQEAGAICTSYFGDNAYLSGGSIIAGNKAIVDTLQKMSSTYFNEEALRK